MIQPYSDDTLLQARKYLSSDALFLMVCSALARHTPLSVIRMGDGEKAIVDFADGRRPARDFLLKQSWQEEYGLVDANYRQVGADLLYASAYADILCLNTAGLYLPQYAIQQRVAARPFYGEGLFAHSWAYMGRIWHLMKYTGDIVVVCRNAAKVSHDMAVKFSRPFLYAEYGCWKDYPIVIDAIRYAKPGLVLVSGGPSGKKLCVDMARFGMVALDTGSAMLKFWATNSVRNGPP
jgi:hypothetical protein